MPASIFRKYQCKIQMNTEEEDVENLRRSIKEYSNQLVEIDQALLAPDLAPEEKEEYLLLRTEIQDLVALALESLKRKIVRLHHEQAEKVSEAPATEDFDMFQFTESEFNAHKKANKAESMRQQEQKIKQSIVFVNGGQYIEKVTDPIADIGDMGGEGEVLVDEGISRSDEEFEEEEEYDPFKIEPADSSGSHSENTQPKTSTDAYIIQPAQIGWERHTKGLGSRMLLQMGWRPGKGLGASVGRSNPLEVDDLDVIREKEGLGWLEEKSDDPDVKKRRDYSAKRKRNSKKNTKPADDAKKPKKKQKHQNVFSFMNNALSGGPQKETSKQNASPGTNPVKFSDSYVSHSIEQETLRLRNLVPDLEKSAKAGSKNASIELSRIKEKIMQYETAQEKLNDKIKKDKEVKSLLKF